jgi:hypothetical protein
MTRPTVYLHIGMNKTGTSALQRFFAQNQVRLAENGVLYPVSGRAGDAHYCLSRALGFGDRRDGKVWSRQSRMVWKALAYLRPGNRWFGVGPTVRWLTSRAFRLVSSGSGNPTDEGRRLRELFHAEVTRSGAQAVICSSESFVIPGDIAAVRAFFAPLPVRIVVYLRRHDLWWPSVYSQALKMVEKPAWPAGMAGYLKAVRKGGSHRGRYLDLLERWAAVFGDDALIVRPYERQQNRPNIAADFLCAVGLQGLEEKLARGAEQVNETISARGLMLLEIYRRIDTDDRTRRRLINYAVRQMEGEAPLAMLSPETRRQLIEENMGDYREIARRYLGRTDGRLFFDDEPKSNGTWTAPSPLSTAEVLQETIRALGGKPS